MTAPTVRRRVEPLHTGICCYCSALQETPPPPALVDCVNCGHPFRVFRAEANVKPIELGPAARDFFARQKRNAA